MDIQRYAELKERGLITLQKAGSAVIIIKEKYDPETGQQVEPEIEPVNMRRLEEQKEKFQEILEAVEALIGDTETILNQGE